MAQYRSEYSAPTVASASCSYNKLGCYYGPNSTMPALAPGQTKGFYVTPNYGAIGYDALTHGVGGGCTQYFNIQDAYGKGAANCSTSYTTRLCGSACGGGGGGGGMGKGWQCDPKQGKCVYGAHLGTQGTFGSAYQCQAACHRV